MPKKIVKKGKKKHKNKPTSKKYKMYKITGDKIERKRSCPRCGPGVFLMNSRRFMDLLLSLGLRQKWKTTNMILVFIPSLPVGACNLDF